MNAAAANVSLVIAGTCLFETPRRHRSTPTIATLKLGVGCVKATLTFDWFRRDRVAQQIGSPNSSFSVVDGVKCVDALPVIAANSRNVFSEVSGVQAYNFRRNTFLLNLFSFFNHVFIYICRFYKKKRKHEHVSGSTVKIIHLPRTCVLCCFLCNSDFYYYYLSDRLFVNCKLFHNVSLILLIVTETEKLVKSSKRKYAA